MSLQETPKTRPSHLRVPDLGVGIGLRIPHYRHVLDARPSMDFFEVISENFMVAGGKPLFHLDAVRESYPVIQHGVSLSIGGPDDLDRDYLKRLKALVRRIEPAWLSDHFCWCGAGGAHLHDLLPLPYTSEAVRRLAERARQVQDYLEVPFALENTSSYLTYTASSMTEWEFVTEVVERADVGLMFDVNNVYVSAYNHGFEPLDFIRGVPLERVVQIHMAGHTNLGTHIIDTHRGTVIDPVLRLYQETIRRAGPISTLLEWDDEIPDFEVVSAEATRLREARARALEEDLPELDSLPITRTNSASEQPSLGDMWQQGGPRGSAAQEDVARTSAQGAAE